MEKYIIDSSAIFFRKGLYPSMVTVPEVIKEIRDSSSVDYLSFIDLEVKEPDGSCVEEIEKIAKRSGDIYRLSETDIKLLALALTVRKEGFEPVIVTDDYSIQNVAKIAQLKTDSIIQKGISKEFMWIRRCRGCKREVEDGTERCPICGSEIYLSRVKIKRDKT
jgi:UPF0271 protein